MMYPTMSFRDYIRRWSAETKDGMFWCEMCGEWINKQRWIHFKTHHRYETHNVSAKHKV